MTVLSKISNLKSHISNLIICFVSIFLFLGFNSAKAQLTFNNGLSAQQLAQMLAGPGITISNAVINCASNAIGSFTGSSSIGFASGILLTTGSTSVASPNTNSSSAGVSNSYPGDSQLDPMAGAPTHDACALEFDIIPLCDTVSFNYSFGSDEYPEFVNSGYNDAFAFYISGPGITGQPNIATLPGTSTFVTIDNVNANTNSQYYVANSGTTIEYDGYTTVLTAWTLVQACQTYHMKIVIADAGDYIYDSGVFLEAGTLHCQSITASATVQSAIEGCQDGIYQFCRPTATASPQTINYTIAGTAVNGTDYNTITNSITIPAGQTCVTLPIVPIVDGLSEGNETILLIYQPGPCPLMDTAKIIVSDSPQLDAGPDTTFCSGGTATIGIPPVTGTTYSWTPSTGLSNAAISNPSVTLTNGGTTPIITNYILTANTSGCISTDTVKVTVTAFPTVNAGPDQIICDGTVTLFGIINGGVSTGIWSGGTGTFNPGNTFLNCVYTPSFTEVDAGSITLILTSTGTSGSCPPASDTLVILISPQMVVSAGPDQIICIGNTITLAGSIAGTSSAGIWTGGTGTYNPDNTNPTAIYTPSAAEETAGTVTLTYSPIDTAGSCNPVDDQMVITINHLPTANAGSAQDVCSGSSVTLAGSIGGSATIGTWMGGSGTFSPDNTTLNAVYTPSAAEIAVDSVVLTLTTDDPAGPCTFSSSNVTFHFYQSPVVNFIADTSAGCPIHCTSFTNLSTIGNGGTIVSWIWDFGDGSPGSTLQNPTHCFSLTGFYDIKLVATSNNGCVSSLTQIHLVQVFSTPVAAFNPTPGDATILDPTITFNNQSSSDVNYWNWDFGDGDSIAPGISSPVHVYSSVESGTYLATLIVHNADGCYDTIVHEIIIGPSFNFFIPNAFSPNGNGTNDYFFGSGIGIQKYDLWIFDRWGNMIFHGKELNDKWNGKANDGSDLAQIDVFVWKVEITDVLNKKHNYIGTVTLVK